MSLAAIHPDQAKRTSQPVINRDGRIVADAIHPGMQEVYRTWDLEIAWGYMRHGEPFGGDRLSLGTNKWSSECCSQERC